jgi:hypothetical protein
VDEDEQSPAAGLLRAARVNGPPPPAGAKERAMAALDGAAAEAATPDGAEVPSSKDVRRRTGLVRSFSVIKK